MMFHREKLVVCINGQWAMVSGVVPSSYPEKGRIYTIRDIEHFDLLSLPEPQLFLELHEIAPEAGTNPFWWDATYFRPIKSTSIEQFESLLKPVPSRTTVREDA